MSRNRYYTITTMLSIMVLFTAPVLATPPEPAAPIKEQPISIYADRLSIDDTTGISLYRGHVELQQGDLKFSGDELEITQKEGTIILMQAKGKPAHFKRSNPEPLKARAMHIDYDNDKGEVILRGEAQLWQNGDQFSGEIIHYYIDSRRVQAQGDSQGKQGSGRVHVLIRPKEDGK